MANRQSVPRIRSVQFKNGGFIRLLRDPVDRDRKYIEDGARQTIAMQHDIAGYAIVVWGKDLSSTCHAYTGPRSVLPSIYVPDYVRNRLLASKIEQLAVDTICGEPK